MYPLLYALSRNLRMILGSIELWQAQACSIIPIVICISCGQSIFTTLLVSTVCSLTYGIVYLYATLIEIDRKFDGERTRSLDLESRIETAQALHHELVILASNLQDELEDLKTVQAKVEQQAIVIQRLQARNDNLNYLIQHGKERRRGTTLEDVYKLTGEGNVRRDPPPSFNELDQQLKDADDDRSKDHS